MLLGAVRRTVQITAMGQTRKTDNWPVVYRPGAGPYRRNDGRLYRHDADYGPYATCYVGLNQWETRRAAIRHASSDQKQTRCRFDVRPDRFHPTSTFPQSVSPFRSHVSRSRLRKRSCLFRYTMSARAPHPFCGCCK
jgi:hypothetical protein